MQLTNLAGGLAAWTLGLDPDGRERAVVVLKRTLRIPAEGRVASFADDTEDFVYADEFEGEPGLSAPTREYDFAATKPACDVLVDGPAVAPRGEPVRSLAVGVKFGAVRKVFRALGPRCWIHGVGGLRPSEPEAFSSVPIGYSSAYGGTDVSGGDPKTHVAYRANPVGLGFAPKTPAADLDGTPLPTTEEEGRPIRSPGDRLKPMAFGPLGKAWEPRIGYGGSYDDDWLENVFPFQPADFDPRYFQAAPADQQTPYPTGGEEAVLLGLTSDGRRAFRLPDLSVPVVFARRGEGDVEAAMRVDTIAFAPSRGLATLSWRASLPLKRDAFEIAEAIVGRMSGARRRARAVGKTYLPPARHRPRLDA